MTRHAHYFDAKQVSYAGILPTALRANRLRLPQGDTAADTTCRAVTQVIRTLVSRQDGPTFVNLVVLGGRGNIGRQLIRTLTRRNENASATLPPILVIDKGDALPGNGPVLLVNCSLPGAIDEHALSIPFYSMVLNEVYPAPKQATIDVLTGRSVKLFHVSGVQGKAWPAFPHEYRDAIPCCAALADQDLQAVVTQLN